MQYILTEAEYRELKREHNAKEKVASDRLQEICTLAALHIPVQHDWSEDKTPRPWGCILTDNNPVYCDDCPVRDICPNPNKEWSQ